MWDAIQANHRRSWILIGIMALILVTLGVLIGLTVVSDAKGAIFGAVIALGIWGILMAVTFLQGEQVIVAASGAKRLQKQDAPRLWNVVEEMAIASGLPKLPGIYVIEDDAPNAFAAGRDPRHAIVAVTSGMLARLDRDELQGVIAHEIAHIKNQDVRFMTIASVMVGSIVLISQTYLQYVVFGGGRRRTSSRGGGSPWLMVIAVIAAILAPIAARLLYFACSRRREYLADACAARFTRYPDGLASALEKIAGRAVQKDEVNRALVPMYIVNPLASKLKAVGPFSTHPPTPERIKILRSMGGRAGYVDYEAAYRKQHGKQSRCLGMRSLTSSNGRSIEARAPLEPQADGLKESVERVQEVTDLLSRMANFLMLTCICGVKIRIPDEFKRPSISCPRCGHANELPRAQEGGPAGPSAQDPREHDPKEPAHEEASGAPEASPATEPSSETATATETADEPVTAEPELTPLRFERTGTSWESFRCSCDRVIQLAPGFKGQGVKCPCCRKMIEVVVKQPETVETVA